MEPDKTLLRLRARIKLLKRHVQEWSALLKQQREVVRSVNVEAKLQPCTHTHTDNKLTMIQQIVGKSIRLHQVNVRQSIEREEMKTRHHQEEAELEKTINSLL